MNKKVLVGTIAVILGGVAAKTIKDIVEKRKEIIENEVKEA